MTEAFALMPSDDIANYHRAEPSTIARSASSLRLITYTAGEPATQGDRFATPLATSTEAATQFISAATVATASSPEPTDEELAAAGLAFVAEFEREFGAIPDEIIAEIQRKWPG